MKIDEYCGKLDYSILQFIFSFIDHTREKIEKKELFYKEQIARYVQRQIDFFFKEYNIKTALLQSYKYEIYNTIMFKLKNILKENHVLLCVYSR
ncbi:hypothetical protein [Bacillus sp. EB600]|uniref:hypothetical protein n=1 Tax=Bacillus sp. EB600 TaxID=2806345 RepID=UPI00210D7152|nr:hypothetical protein [Bacillus sp. EB600]MCQ6279347.1 hypothetical protein [Bacillus sp. EB600]